MGSLNATGIPVPQKLNVTLRKHDIIITQTTSADDAGVVVTSNRPDIQRTIGSGSIVRDDNLSPATVEYFEEVTWGTNFGSRSTTERLARDGARDQSVSDTDNIVIEAGLVPDVPQQWSHHEGDFIVRKNSATDVVVDRVSNSGAYG